MDLYNFRLPLLFLAAFGCCCDGSPLLDEETNGVIGKHVTFKTTVISMNFLTVSWSFDGAVTTTLPILTNLPLANKTNIDDRYKNRVTYNATTCELELRNLVKEDSGEYVLTIVTGEGSQLIGKVILNVLEPVTDVKISSNLPDPVEIHSTVVLTCSAKGSFTYKWVNGSIPVVADGTHIMLMGKELTVSKVWRTDLRGPIFCIAENALESGKSPAFNLTVSYGPENIVMSQTPVAPFLKEGSNVTFTCSAISDPPAQLQWMFNGVEVSKQANLTITKLEGINSGNYTCLASNANTKHSIASQVSTISVVEPLSGTNISSPSEPLIAGISPVNLTCTVAAGKADRVDWFKDGKPLATSARVTLSSDMRTSSFVKVEKEDAGVYKCQMKNNVNTDEASYTMVINYGPADAIVTGKKAVKFEEPIEMSCLGESVPPSTYAWKLNDSTIVNATREKYTVEKASLKDAGTYTCVARNPLTGLTFSKTHKLEVTELGTVDSGLSGGAIAGIVIGVLVAAIIIACCFCCRKKQTDVPSPY
ncbi:Carcinoembryonic antigen-related cell adhesion molecule 5 [Triplophysa tibetana]|uniref:Carcinoembryonic antigen-related cell adhesion molecule 5 n=1 Tax=Triplophysa tibetana TaxID=1572043 RepID=A0A5A9NJU9_9TELE|nr:Carcinoembryonic antigen-related cell adhesion molecule 5 [Triplophysa tibetana]